MKNFKPTNWFVSNRTAAYFLTIAITLTGIYTFTHLPKENFPDVVVPTIYVTTVQAGSSPKDIENLVTRPLEKSLNAISGGAVVKNIISRSLQDYSTISVEFETGVPISVARAKVKDAVDNARSDLPDELTKEPEITEVNFSDIPVMFVNISARTKTPIELKNCATEIKDKIEGLTEISKVEMVGAVDKIISVSVDKYKLEYGKLSLRDVENAISRENINIGVGAIDMGTIKRNIYINGEFTKVGDLSDIIIKNMDGAAIYLRDIATISEGTADIESYARAFGTPVITLNIIKKGGENLIATSDKIKKIVQDFRLHYAGSDIDVAITGDTSAQTKHSFDELINSIVFGFLLVLIILMFFMGVSTAFFVALSVPLSIFITFFALPLGDLIVGSHITLNFIVLFALLFGLGIIVDDAIVVIENTHRIFNNGKVRIEQATKRAAAEVFLPVLSGTLTTLAPFFPLLFWKGIVGKFMIYLPVILIFTLTASLLVAFLINPIFAVSFMKKEETMGAAARRRFFKNPMLWIAIIAGVVLDIWGSTFWGNMILLITCFLILNCLVLHNLVRYFQARILPPIMHAYEKLLRWSLSRTRPVWLLVAMFFLFIFAIFLAWVRIPASKIFFFPYNANPNKIFVYIKLPVGTNLHYTDSVARVAERRIFKLFNDDRAQYGNEIVESIITNVAAGATNPNEQDRSVQSNRAMIQVAFVESKLRNRHTDMYVDKIRQTLNIIPPAYVSVEMENMGPPTGPPVNIEIAGDNFDTLARVARMVRKEIANIDGVASPKLDTDLEMPEMQIAIDRRKANMDGLSTSQMGSEVRTALFGKEVGTYKYLEESYPIMLRLRKDQRTNIADMLNTYTTFRDNSGRPSSMPLSSFMTIHYDESYGVIQRKNLKRTISVYANIPKGYSATSVNLSIADYLKSIREKLPKDVQINQTGETEEQADTNEFLLLALLGALVIMLTILIIQFNSLSKTIIIMTEIFFSFIGVILGFAITRMEIPSIMIGVGMIGLSGIVVKNAILLIEFSDELRARGLRVREAVIQAGKARIIPVLLTMLATVFGLVPLALGLNIDFEALLRSWKLDIFFGGDSVIFWGPLSWTIIFGLIFAFLLTLTLVPCMYLIAFRLKRPMTRFYKTKWIALLALLGPVFFLLVLIMWIVRKVQDKKMLPMLLKG